MVTLAVCSAIAAFVGSDLPFTLRNGFGVAAAATGILFLALRFVGNTALRRVPIGRLVVGVAFFALATTISFLRD
jgi:hypothetical protein